MKYLFHEKKFFIRKVAHRSGLQHPAISCLIQRIARSCVIFRQMNFTTEWNGQILKLTVQFVVNWKYLKLPNNICFLNRSCSWAKKGTWPNYVQSGVPDFFKIREKQWRHYVELKVAAHICGNVQGRYTKAVIFDEQSCEQTGMPVCFKIKEQQ